MHIIMFCVYTDNRGPGELCPVGVNCIRVQRAYIMVHRAFISTSTVVYAG